MAQQMFVSYSSHFRGFATFSHAFYRCGPATGNIPDYDAVCTILHNEHYREIYDPRLAIQDIRQYHEQGLIDDPKNMANKPIYVFAGTNSTLFNLDLGLGPITVFEPFIGDIRNIKIRVQTADVTMPTDKANLTPCPEFPSPTWFVSSCGFSGAYEALRWMLGMLIVKPPRERKKLQTKRWLPSKNFY